MAKKKQTKKQKKALKKIILSLFVLLAIFIILCFMTPADGDATLKSDGKIKNLEIPADIEGDEVINHTGYTLSYNEEYEIANWVAYELTREEVLGEEERGDDFREDKSVSTGSAKLNDYKGSGYDRGHMAPAADFKWSAEAMSDTFFLSNMAPQDPSFNRGIWGDLEAAVRTMAYDNGSIYVVTGPVLTDGPYKTIGDSEVAVPNYFYKAILDYSEPDIKAIGFVLPNEGSSKSLSSYAVSINDVEEITGLDFFTALPDSQEEEIENSFSTSKWSFRSFVPTGETADVSYVVENDPKAEFLEVARKAFIEFKEAVFEYTGLTKYAKAFGLI